MQHSSHLTSVEILSVQEDYFGPFARMNVRLQDGELEIRWGLDGYTYEHLRKVVCSGFSPSVNYRCMLVLKSRSSHVPNRYVGSLMCQLGTQWIRLEFLCSTLFLSNLEWLRGVDSVQRLRSLAWKRWIESEYDLLYAADIPVHFTSSARIINMQATTTNFVRQLSIVAAITLLGVGVFFGLTTFGPSYQRGTSTVSRTHLFSLITQWVTKEQIGENQQKPLTSTMTPVSNNGKTDGKDRLGGGHLPKARSTIPALALHGVPEIYEVPSGEVALTFNCGPSSYTEQIVQELNRYHVHATFFFIGNNVLRLPNVVQYVAKNGDAIGDQTVDYPDLAKMSTSEQRREILGGIQEINRYVTTPIVLFRPPFDLFNQTTEEIVAQNHLVLALWNRDPRDWAATSPGQVIHSVLHNSASGGVFDLQDTKITMFALPTILKTFESQHLKFVVLSPYRK